MNTFKFLNIFTFIEQKRKTIVSLLSLPPPYL